MKTKQSTDIKTIKHHLMEAMERYGENWKAVSSYIKSKIPSANMSLVQNIFQDYVISTASKNMKSKIAHCADSIMKSADKE